MRHTDLGRPFSRRMIDDDAAPEPPSTSENRRVSVVGDTRAQHAGSEVLETFEPRDLLARILMHVAEPRAHLVRHYGEYSVAACAKRRRQAQPIEHWHELASSNVDQDLS